MDKTRTTKLNLGIYNLPLYGTETDYENSSKDCLRGWIVISGDRVSTYTRKKHTPHIEGYALSDNMYFKCNSVSDFVIAYHFYRCGFQDGSQHGYQEGYDNAYDIATR